MKIGVYCEGIEEEVGGGFTFQDEMLGAIRTLGGATGHEFILLSWDRHFGMSFSEPHICVQHLSHRRRRLARLPGFSSFDPYAPLIDAGVELIWNLTPFNHLTLDIPNITIVWDLQHRLQPFFPEVSQGGEWSHRERKYTQLLQRAAVVICGTLAGQREVKQFYGVPAERLRMLPHPTPGFALSGGAGSSAPLPFPETEPFLFYPAQFWPHKNHVGLLRALHVLREDHQVKLHAVFTGSDKGNLDHVQQAVRHLALESQVHFLGFVSREQLIWLYRKALCLVYPSYFGPENLPPLEAFALGCPVIAAAVPGADEQLGDSALLVPPADPAAFATGILSLLNEPAAWERRKALGRSRASKWTGGDFFSGVMRIAAELEPVCACWGEDRWKL